VIKLVAGRAEAPGWRLVSRTRLGADVLARVATGTDRAAWQRAVERLRDGDGTLSVVRTADGHYKWVLTGQCGTLIADSPPAYRDAVVCRRAFADAQRAARTALGRPSEQELKPW
jgi:hypothetical protein